MRNAGKRAHYERGGCEQHVYAIENASLLHPAPIQAKRRYDRSRKDGQVFAFTVNRNFGRRNWSATRAAASVIPGFEELSGAGDKAMVGSFGHTMYVLKGDSMIQLQLMYVPEARTRGIQIGSRIEARL